MKREKLNKLVLVTVMTVMSCLWIFILGTESQHTCYGQKIWEILSENKTPTMLIKVTYYINLWPRETVRLVNEGHNKLHGCWYLEEKSWFIFCRSQTVVRFWADPKHEIQLDDVNKWIEQFLTIMPQKRRSLK